MEAIEQSLWLVNQMEGEMNKIMAVLNDARQVGISQMKFSELNERAMAKFGTELQFAVVTQRMASYYFRRLFGVKIRVLRHEKWFVLPYVGACYTPRLTARLVRMIEEMARNVDAGKRKLLNHIRPQPRRRPIRVALDGLPAISTMRENSMLMRMPAVMIDFDSLIHRIRLGLLPIKELGEKLKIGRIELVINPYTKATDKSIPQIKKLLESCKSELRIGGPHRIIKHRTARRKRAATTANTGYQNYRQANAINYDNHVSPSWFVDIIALTMEADNNQVQIARARSMLEVLKLMVLELIAKEPRGLTIRELYQAFRDQHHGELRESHPAFTSLKRMVSKLGLQELREGWPGHEHDMFFNLHAPRSNFILDLNLFRPNFMVFGERLAKLPTDAYKQDDTIISTVTWVISPDHFYFIKTGPNHAAALKRLGIAMTEYYNGVAAPLGMYLEFIVPGLVCAVLHGDDWLRAQIRCVHDDGTFTVQCLDYSYERIYPEAFIKPLHRYFAALPIQAIRGRLHCVAPPSPDLNEWLINSSFALSYMTFDKYLYTHIVRHVREEDDNVAEVVLADIERGAGLNASLVKLGFARPLTCSPRCLAHLLFVV